MKILFVCTGNTCRSPMAQGLFLQIAGENGTADRVSAGSAGISAVNGQPASQNAVIACREVGVDISSHQARRLTGQDLLEWDLFFVMSETHGYILEQAGAPARSIYVPGRIADPFGQDLEAYRLCRDELRRGLERFYRDLVEPALKQGG